MNVVYALRVSAFVFPFLTILSTSAAYAEPVVGSQGAGISERGATMPERGTLRGALPGAVAAPVTVVESRANVGISFRASQLIGMEVRDAAGQRLGRIQDLVAAGGVVRYVTVGYSAGAATRAYVVPFQSLLVQQGPRGSLYAQLAIQSTQLRTVPSFAIDQWPDFNDTATTAVYDGFWNRAVVGTSGDVDGLGTNPERVGGTGNFGGTGSTAGPIPTPRGVGGTGNFGGTGSSAGPGRDSTIIKGVRGNR